MELLRYRFLFWSSALLVPQQVSSQSVGQKVLRLLRVLGLALEWERRIRTSTAIATALILSISLFSNGIEKAWLRAFGKRG